VAVIEGAGSLLPHRRVAVADQVLSATTIVLAAGSIKRAIPGVEFGGPVIGTEEAWALERLPPSLAVIGAGASGVEIASAYARLGVEVTLVEALERVLAREDEDISRLVERGLKRQGIRVETTSALERVEVLDDHVRFTHGDTGTDAEWLVIAAGWTADIGGLGLAQAGVESTGDGLVEVDEMMRTSADGIYAIGDMVPGPALAHKASDEGVLTVEHAAGLRPDPVEHVDIPRATFCLPNVASFGLTERHAREKGHDVTIGKVQYGAVGAGTVYGDRGGLVKIVGDHQDGTILGAHIVGAKATELIQQLVNVKVLEGGFPDIAGMTHGHPTMSEAVLEAARAADGWLIHG
jgi:dihydrolipoamide dehydrogenase